jgi:hypothetical protein
MKFNSPTDNYYMNRRSSLKRTATIMGIAGALAIGVAACDKRPGLRQQTEVTGTSTTTAQVLERPVVLSNYRVHYVRLPYAHNVISDKGDRRSFSNAWLVVFSLQNLGAPRGLATEFYIGEYRIPEYGGVTNGIYFRIYEEAKLRSLDGQEISMRDSGAKRTSLNQKFVLPDLKTLQPEEESAVLKRRTD